MTILISCLAEDKDYPGMVLSGHRICETQELYADVRLSLPQIKPDIPNHRSSSFSMLNEPDSITSFREYCRSQCSPCKVVVFSLQSTRKFWSLPCEHKWPQTIFYLSKIDLKTGITYIVTYMTGKSALYELPSHFRNLCCSPGVWTHDQLHKYIA